MCGTGARSLIVMSLATVFADIDAGDVQRLGSYSGGVAEKS